MNRFIWLLSIAVAVIACWFTSVGHAAERPNVLMILVDDLKPAIGAYGDPHAKTPHLDALTRRGMRFDAAYCNQAVCAPSRFSLMLGSHSTTSGLYGLGSSLRDMIPDAVTLPQYFAAHGYRTESLGKVFHIGHGNFGDPQSFSVPHFHEKVIEYADPASTPDGKLTREEAYFTNQQLGNIRSLPRGAAYESPDVADDAYADGRVAAETIVRLRAAKQRRDSDSTPFFIATGFARPHLPFSAPKKYWDLYDPATLPMPAIETPPIDAPPVAGKRGGEITNFSPVPEEKNADFSEGLKRKLIHGYYASVSYTDAQIGKVIAALDETGLADNTIVVLWGDHGFHLGDLGIWTKHTNYEQANRIPIVMVAPGVTRTDQSTQQLIESVDVYPTLAELAGLPTPTGPQSMDGVSMVPVLKDPSQRVRDHAFHAYPKRLLGRAIRTSRYRMVEWKDRGAETETATYELYDYQIDSVERRNLAEDEPEILKRHQEILARYPEAVSGRKRPVKVKNQNSAATDKPKPNLPNIVTVFIDDMGYTDLSCFGGKRAVTEHIDSMASEGIRFTNFYVNSPICSPSRTALTTGQYPQRWRISSYLNNRRSNHERGVAQWLDPAAPVLARELQKRGYATGHFGKWHMGGQRDVGEAPLINEYGFDASLTNFEGLGPRVLGLKKASPNDKPKLHDLGSNQLGRGPIEYADRSEITTKFVERAVEHIDQAQAAGKPFFVNVWPDDVHSPFFPPHVLRDATDESKRSLYYAVLDSMDEQLAALFDRIRNDASLRENTLVVICSDNGHEHGAGMSDPLRGSKTWLYEGGIRSPLIVWGPGLISSEHAGTTNTSSFFSAIDLNRSLYELTGTPIPANTKLDGENLIDTLLGRSPAGRSTPLCFRRPPDRPGFSQGLDEDNPDLAVRDGKWKLLINYDGGDAQLYNLEADASETKDRSLDHPEIVERLKAFVFEWNAGLPKDAGDPSYLDE